MAYMIGKAQTPAVDPDRDHARACKPGGSFPLNTASLFDGYHELRLEGTQIMGPFGRGRFDWETTGGTLMQFRYRLGF